MSSVKTKIYKELPTQKGKSKAPIAMGMLRNKPTRLVKKESQPNKLTHSQSCPIKPKFH